MSFVLPAARKILGLKIVAQAGPEIGGPWSRTLMLGSYAQLSCPKFRTPEGIRQVESVTLTVLSCGPW